MSDDREILMGLVERMSVLETKHENSEKRQEESFKKIDAFMAKFDRYEAKWGGVVMVLSAIGAMVAIFKSELLKYFGGK